MRPQIYIQGITYSMEEAKIAEAAMDRCVVADIERELPESVDSGFDTILFSHVLEHLRNPDEVVARFAERLNPGGQILIAVPNVASWRTRIRLLGGGFQYEEFGVFDNTHLRFFTYYTAADYLLGKCAGLTRVTSSVDGSVPLWPLRKHMPIQIAAFLDSKGCKYWPNLFGSQVLVDARRAHD